MHAWQPVLVAGAPALDGPPVHFGSVLLSQLEVLPVSNTQHLLDQVQPCDLLRHRVLHLKINVIFRYK